MISLFLTGCSKRSILLGLFLTILICAVQTRPPSPIQCESGAKNCTVTNTYGMWPDRGTCRAAQVMYPRTEQELVEAVGYGVRHGLKMKAVSRGSHSIPKLVCPGGSQGLLISTQDYASNISVDMATMTVTADSGVSLRDLVDNIATHDLALPHSPYFDGLSIGGMLATGAHGSSLWSPGSYVSGYLTKVRLVVPDPFSKDYARIISFSDQDEELNAVMVNLGVLGVVSQVTLQLQPMFKRALTYVATSDDHLEDEIVEFGNANEFGDITWYAGQHKAVFRKDNRVSVQTAGNGANDYFGFKPFSSALLATQRLTEELYEATKNSKGKCASSKLQVSTILSIAAGLKNNAMTFTGYPVIGFQNKIQASGKCQNTSDPPMAVCAWDPRVKGEFFHQTTFSIALTKVKDFILDTKKLREIRPSSLCGPDLYVGFLFRYVKSSSAYLAPNQDSVDIDITYYRSKSAFEPRLDEDVLEEIEQMAFFKYGALPHWGKNRNVAFLGAAAKYPQMPTFLQVKLALDPLGHFSSEWSDAVLGLDEKVLTNNNDHCALEGLCICAEDKHCAPENKYFCRPGKVFEGARVCTS